jgi:ArsR family transcriptional regulator, arsenate/arsenite/antimonite-responsive transcriptional repressor
VRNGSRTGADRVARGFHALADPTRLRILLRLGDGEECVCNLTGPLEAGQSRLSFHLKTLKDAGLVRDRRAGRWIYYSLEPGALEALEAFLGSLRSSDRALRRVAARCCD